MSRGAKVKLTAKEEERGWVVVGWVVGWVGEPPSIALWRIRLSPTCWAGDPDGGIRP